MTKKSEQKNEIFQEQKDLLTKGQIKVIKGHFLRTFRCQKLSRTLERAFKS